MIGASHAHVPRRRFDGTYCALCFRSLRALLESEAFVEIVFERPIEQWTAWQTPRTDEVGKS